MLKRLKGIVILFLFIVSISYLLKSYLPEIEFRYFWITQFVLFSGTIMAHGFIYQSEQSTGKPFVQQVILTTVVRLTFYAMYAFAIIYITDGSVFYDIILFASIYLTVTLYDIFMALKKGS